MGVISAAWVLLKRRAKVRSDGSQVEQIGQGIDNWEDQKKAYETVLNQLQGEEQIIHKHLIDSGGEMLQKNI